MKYALNTDVGVIEVDVSFDVYQGQQSSDTDLGTPDEVLITGIKIPNYSLAAIRTYLQNDEDFTSMAIENWGN